MTDKDLEDAVKSYNELYSRDANRRTIKYGPERASIIALEGKDSLDVVIEVSTKLMPNKYATPEEFADIHLLPRFHDGYKVSYRILKVPPPIMF